MSVTSAPATLAIKVKNDGNKFVKPVKEAANKATQFVSERLNESFKNLKEKYTEAGGKAWDNIKSAPEEQQKQFKQIEGIVKTSGGMINQHKEDINYYAFTAGYLVKGLLKKLPIVAMDSAMEAYWGSNSNQFLSVQKFMKIFNSSKFNKALAAVAAQVMQKKTTIENMTPQDAYGFWKVIRESGGSQSEIDAWLEKVEKNASDLEENYCNATKLLLHLMVGKTALNGLSTNIETLKNKVTELEDKLKGIDGLQGMIEGLKSQLETLKNTNSLGDPCSDSTQK